MREVAFIKQNKETWLQYEKILRTSDVKPEILEKMFVKLTNDLAFSQTYYPKSNLNKYLNALNAHLYNKVIKPKKDWFGFFHFWFTHIPLLMYQYRRYLYFSLCFFLFAVAIGVVSTHYDDTFVRTILGDDYVDRTLDNMESGDPMKIYSNETVIGDLSSSFQITLNNLRVGLLSFLSGIFFGVGTIMVLFPNGVMLGTFQGWIIEQGFLVESVRAIWIHGAMEIFAIVVEGAAGILLGLSWLLPGDMTRKKAFFVKGKHAAQILMSTMPFTIAAGILEGFVTQYADEMTNYVAFPIIIITFSGIVFYYMIYPFIVKNKIPNFNYFISEYEEA